MARKDLLKGLIAGAAAEAGPAQAVLPPRPVKGAIGAVSQSIAELRGRAVIDVPAGLIDDAGLKDRLEPDEGIAALAASIRDYGQQVPVLLRHSPQHEGRYEIVYGRRRVAALRSLGLPVKAMLRDLSQHDLIVAQGQENAARKDLSFIEKANFAHQMVAQGFERRVICDALHIDKTVISRMLSVVEALPDGLIALIGAAPSAGRDRWLALAERAKGQGLAALADLVQGDSSDARFLALFEALAPGRRPPRPAPAAPIAGPAALQGVEGQALGQARRGRRGAQLTLTDPQFSGWIIENIEEIHRQYLRQAPGKARE